MTLLGLHEDAVGKTLTYRRNDIEQNRGWKRGAFSKRHETDLLEDVAYGAIRLAGQLEYEEPQSDYQQLRLVLAG